MLGRGLVLAAHHTCDGCRVRFDELTQHMDAQIASGTSQENMAQLLAFALEERLNIIPLQDDPSSNVAVPSKLREKWPSLYLNPTPNVSEKK